MGSKEVAGRAREWCAACDKVYFHNPIAAAAAVIMEGNRILLCRRKGSVFRGQWSIPAGFCEEDETIEACAVREAREETGLEVEILGLIDVNSGFEVPGRPVVGAYYRVKVVGGTLQAGDDAEEARYFALEEAPDLPFAGDRRVIDILRSGRYPYEAVARPGESG